MTRDRFPPSIDDLHQCALAEFELDEDAQHVFEAIYAAMLQNYIAALKLLRLRRQRVAPWKSSAS
jgi:hypothetical protein